MIISEEDKIVNQGNKGENMKKLIGAGPRIRKWRKSKGLKSYTLAKIIKVSQGSLSDIENSKSDPSARTILNFFIYTDIDFIWMITGKSGEIERGEIPVEDPPMIITLPKNVKEILIKRDE